VVAASDASWLNVPHPAFERATARMSCQLGFDELYDARRAMGDWTLPRYDDYEWNEAVEIGEAGCAPWGELHPRPIPLLTLEPVAPKVVERARVVKPPLAAWAFDLKPYLAPDDLSANPRVLSGVVATEIRADAPCTLRIGDVHHGLREADVRLNGEPVPYDGGMHTLRLQAGSHLLTIDVSRWYHDWFRYFVVEAAGDAPVRFVNPLMERADYPWVVLGPFDGDEAGYQRALALRTPAEIRHHPKAHAFDPMHTARAPIFALTNHHAQPTGEPRAWSIPTPASTPSTTQRSSTRPRQAMWNCASTGDARCTAMWNWNWKPQRASPSTSTASSMLTLCSASACSGLGG
jgi:hypothetical protein